MRVEYVLNDVGLVLYASNRAALLAAAPEFADMIRGRVHDDDAPCWIGAVTLSGSLDGAVMIFADRIWDSARDPQWFRALLVDTKEHTT